MVDRKYQIVLWGASGFTGKLVCEYLHEKYGGTDLRWAVAGRNKKRLEDLKRELGCPGVPVLLADSFRKDLLVEMASQTEVVISTVGPYALYGSTLIEACIESGTDYCDLSGEVHWMREMIDRWQEKAVRSGVRVVHCCGFDSIPSDLGVLYMQKKAVEKTGQPFKNISMRVRSAKGGLSGGTFASMFNIREEAEKNREIYKVIMRRYSLNPDPEWDGPDARDLKKVEYDKVAKSWVSPFIMATINTRIVRRSHALSDFPYGRDFTYDEAIWCGPGWRGKLRGWMYILPLGIVRAAKPGSLLYKILQYFIPKPGQGPSREKIEKGYFKLYFFGTDRNGKHWKGSLSGKRDPGYGATARMLAESAVCLALDREETPRAAGFLTPATAMGFTLIDRLEENAEISFKFEGSVQEISNS
nr:saccharopine dehydrogenase NADP-binding domain-containing protein [Saprospiraceae bacterium]